MASGPVTITYVGHGQSGVWADPLNWAGGVVPGAANAALFTSSAVLDGPVDVFNLMLLGNETIAINGAITTGNTNVCQSFMVCEGAVVTFNAGSSLTDAGGFVTGIDAAGSVTVDGAQGGRAAAVVTAQDMKLGQAAGASGTLTLNGGMFNVVGAAYVGQSGQGSMSVAAGSVAHFESGLTLGENTGGTGVLSVLHGGTVSIAGWSQIGTAVPGAPGGTATVSIAAGGSYSCANGINVWAGSTVTMAGGSLTSGGGTGVQTRLGGTISGFGTVSSVAVGMTDNGVLASAGGTLSVTGNLVGMGAVQVGAGSTLDLIASKIQVPTLSFLGVGGTLELSAGVTGGFTIAGFAAGDQILMNGIDAVSWNGTTDVLTLSENGHAIDHLQFSGLAAGSAFDVTQGSLGSVISIAPPVSMPPVSAGGFGIAHH